MMQKTNATGKNINSNENRIKANGRNQSEVTEIEISEEKSEA